jgi:tetratricopeptide (TPR) repeat protein
VPQRDDQTADDAYEAPDGLGAEAELDPDPPGEAATPDPITRRLVVAIGLLIIAILSVTVYLVYDAFDTGDGPRTAVERDLEQAEADFREHPGSYDFAIRVAALQISAERYDEALETVEAARELEDDRAATYLALGDIAIAREDLEGALDYFEQGLEIAETPPERVVHDALEKGVRLPDDYAQEAANPLAYGAAQIHVELGQLDEAAEKLELALKYHPQDAESLTMLGHVYAELDEAEQARAAYEEALRYIPDYAPAIQGLEEIDE